MSLPLSLSSWDSNPRTPKGSSRGQLLIPLSCCQVLFGTVRKIFQSFTSKALKVSSKFKTFCGEVDAKKKEEKRIGERRGEKGERERVRSPFLANVWTLLVRKFSSRSQTLQETFIAPESLSLSLSLSLSSFLNILLAHTLSLFSSLSFTVPLSSHFNIQTYSKPAKLFV